MGFRFRKSVNLGGGFRVNISNSGVGYSWGTKGFRLTKTAKGNTRVTSSIPGTGISYSKEVGGNSNRNSRTISNDNNNSISSNYYDIQEIKNFDASTLSSEGLEEMLISANRAVALNLALIYACFLCVIFCFFIPFLWFVAIICLICYVLQRKIGRINLDYTFDDNQAEEIAKKMEPLLKMAKSKKLWWISQTQKVVDRKYSSGIGSSVKRENCTVSTKAPFPFSTVAPSITFKSGSETLLFLPDKLFVIQGSKIGALNYSDVNMSLKLQRFHEEGNVPDDAKIINYTWQYVNKSGGPDKRFEKNKRIPICLYGEIDISSSNGLNTRIMYSNVEIFDNWQEKIIY